MSLTVTMISPIAWVRSLSATMLPATASPCSRIDSIAFAVSVAARRPERAVCAAAWAVAMTSVARFEIWAPEWVISSTVAAVSCTAANCSSTLAACSWAEARISAAAAFRSAVAARLVRARSDRPATIRFSVSPSRPISSLPVRLRRPVRSPEPICATNAITSSSGRTTARLISTVTRIESRIEAATVIATERRLLR
ncbi:hypothetical protein CHKEEEPN_0768 [Methylorubrum podarium]|nr:hypothetical protein CHKEEEPN_0768 [Methylorubrum podarium]